MLDAVDEVVNAMHYAFFSRQARLARGRMAFRLAV
jgi:hypothetical protein